MIKHLHQRHRVTVASLVRNREEAQAASGIASFCTRYIAVPVRERLQQLGMVLCLPTAIPSSMGYFYSLKLQQAIRTELAQNTYDLVIVHCSSVAPYVAAVTEIPKVLDFCDMDSQKWLSYSKIRGFPRNMGYWLEGTKLLRAEKKLARRFDVCTCATVEELATLQNFATHTATDWFPNGVDHDFFAPRENGDYDPDLISFVGRMDYYPNEQCMVDFCRDTLPLLRRKRPALKLTIIGASPSAKVRALAASPGVSVTGSVADVRPYVQVSAVMVAPLSIARGTQNKLLEAMALGVPVVTSPLAARGVDARVGEHLLTAATPGEYCTAILRLLDAPQERQRLAVAARAQVVNRHSWPAAMARFDAIVTRCLQATGQRPQC